MIHPAAAVRRSGEDARRVFRRTSNPYLFRPLTLRGVTLPNRIALSPMCQYSATEGEANDWHLIHLGSRAVGGVGLVFTEAVHVEPRGRITPNCLGLWNDDQSDGLSRIASFISEQGVVAGIQLGHAGRKASTGRPWEGSAPLSPKHGGWSPIGPSARAFAPGWPTPDEMDHSGIARVIDAFVQATRRATEAGYQVIEIHAAHGYLFHQFLSPRSNQRTDTYGGSFDNRVRFLMEVLAAVRYEWPEDFPIFVRLSITDWMPGGWTTDDSSRLARLLHSKGLADLIDCSAGGNDSREHADPYPGYQVPLASRVRAEAGIATGAVGLINSPELAESILAGGHADLILLGRALLADPLWPRRAAAELRAETHWPVQYERADIY